MKTERKVLGKSRTSDVFIFIARSRPNNKLCPALLPCTAMSRKHDEEQKTVRELSFFFSKEKKGRVLCPTDLYYCTAYRQMA
jgi:hypothetical protein